MKRGLALSLALGLALSLLTSCELMVPGPTERPPLGPSGEPSPTGSAEPSQSQAQWQEGSGPDFDRRFSKVISNICATRDTVYFSPFNSHLIYYADKATGICLPVCGKPECDHNDENCNAYVHSSSIYGLTSYNGRLYWVGDVKINEKWQDHILSMAYDGTDRRTGREISDWGSCLQAQIHRGYLYRSYVTQVVVDAVPKSTVHVAAYSLDGDEDGLVILSEEVAYGSQTINIQAYGDYVYIALETADGAFALYRWDTRAGVLEDLYCGTVPFIWDRQFWVMEDGVIVGSREYTGPDEDPEASWEYVLYRFSIETAEFELLNRLQLSEERNVNVIISDGMVIANWWEPNSDSVRVLVKDFEGQAVLDATFEDVEWYFAPPTPMTGYGMDESYLYFTKYGIQYIAVSRDGSEIRLLLDLESQ